MTGLTWWLCIRAGAAVSPVSPAATLTAIGEEVFDSPTPPGPGEHSAHAPLMRSEKEKEELGGHVVHATGEIRAEHVAPPDHHNETPHQHPNRAPRTGHEAKKMDVSEGHTPTPESHVANATTHGKDHNPTDTQTRTLPMPDGIGVLSKDEGHSMSNLLEKEDEHEKSSLQDALGPPPAAAPLTHRANVGADGSMELAQLDAESEFLPALGINNPNDIAYRAMDMMMGIASIIPEDYPFVCICLNTGLCEENVPPESATPCPSRIGQKAGAASTGLVASLVLTALALVFF